MFTGCALSQLSLAGRRKDVEVSPDQPLNPSGDMSNFIPYSRSVTVHLVGETMSGEYSFQG